MDVIGHDNIFVNCHAEDIVPGFNVFLDNFPISGKLYKRGVESAATYNMA